MLNHLRTRMEAKGAEGLHVASEAGDYNQRIAFFLRHLPCGQVCYAMGTQHSRRQETELKMC
jgi:hypothetical protein